jgi:predicted  nucleic acid-binding Zn-ribbon protein
MQTRHRIPSVFNLSMVDVLCCALGCVIMLWLLNSRDAKDRAREAGSTRSRLAVAETSLAGLDKEVKDLRDRLTRRTAEKEKLEEDIAALRSKSAAAEKELARLTSEQRDLLKALAALKVVSAGDKDKLRQKTLELRDLEKALAALKTQKVEVDKRLRSSEELVIQLRADIKGIRDKLASAEGRVLALEKDLADRQKELAAAGKNLSDAKRKLLLELAEARVSIEDLKRDKRALTTQVARARAAADNRFAGIALTGKRVVFLVDMSGSMELVDEKTLAPEKWSGVRDTLSKVMRSLPDLEKFHVILFSDKVTYLLGNPNHWLDFDPKASADRVARELAKVKPTGGTNMYSAFAAAFRFRPAGLDTIYVLSDGLPNMGEGLTPEEARRLRENEQAEILSRYIRRKLKTDWNRPLAGKRVRINTIGFFYESPDVGAFLWALARENDGSFVGMSRP